MLADANWGRILAAVGGCGVDVDVGVVGLEIAAGTNVDIFDAAEGKRLGSENDGRASNSSHTLKLVERGTPCDYCESTAASIFKHPEICMKVDLGVGGGAFTMWTCDLSKEYVEINADYRT